MKRFSDNFSEEYPKKIKEQLDDDGFDLETETEIEPYHEASEDLLVDELNADSDDETLQELRWSRPPLELQKLNPIVDNIAIQWFDLDMTSGEPWKNPEGIIVGSNSGPVPIIRLYGTTINGSSILVIVHGFTPYLYVSVDSCQSLDNHFLSSTRTYLNQKLREKCRGDEKRLLDMILDIQKVSGKQSLMTFSSRPNVKFLKIFVAMPSLVPCVKRIFDDGFTLADHGLIKGTTFESNVPFILRFMIDIDIRGADWIELKAGKYVVRQENEKISRCSIEADICYNHLLTHESVGEWSSIAPLRMLSFDIECQGRKGHFPDAQQDPIIQIANIVTVQGQDGIIAKNVFTLKNCLPIVGAQVIASETEEELLLKWKEFVCTVDPDVITGYNIGNFDLPYLLNRAKALEKNAPKLKRFPDLGRIKNVKATMKETVFQSSAFGKRENIETTINGRIIFDVLPYMYRNHKLSSYSLNSVSAEFLGQQKEDVHHSIISDLQQGTDADRHRLAVYCLKDAQLPQLLMEKLAILVNYIEMARVTGVPINFLLTRGQQIKVFSMILRKTKTVDLLVPNVARSGPGNNDDVNYEGAIVIEPKKAFYEVPIATLDFASLYPSIMQAHNLCYSTLITPEEAKTLNPDLYEKSPSGHIFAKASHKKGILPQILDELLVARKKAKVDMAAATDPMVKAVQNGRQLALKISANSVYGFTGATVGQLPCVAIASSVTAYGRDLLFQTRTYIESTYTISNGYQYNAEVVYGDTDSVMVKFGCSTVEEAMPLARKAADDISQIFRRPIKLEFEKIYFPYLLMNKKRYAGLIWTNPGNYDKMDAKGLETVRRDNCLLVRKVVDHCLRMLLIERNIQGAIDYAKRIISELLQNKLDISMLVISKSLGKSADDADYSAKQAHVELAMRMKKRDPGSAPNVGDRVAYVIIQAAKGVPAYEKSEDPVYVLENNLPIDTEYYLSNQLAGPLTRIFEPIISNPSTLLTGDHTRSVCKPTPIAKAGGIMLFAIKRYKCLSCKVPIDSDNPLCSNCVLNKSEIYLQKLQDVNDQQSVFSKLWTECQRCQGSFHQEVICSNRDCPIYYKRKKAQIDLQAAQKVLDRFNW